MDTQKTYYNGVLLVDKEEGISSYDVIRKLKPLIPRKTKIGHAGTLDPFATGLLIVLIGKYTKFQSDYMSLPKKYRYILELGYETDTQDLTGEILHADKKLKNFSEQDILSVIQMFQGELEQIPPSYSAKKISGRSAYKYAREGQKVKLEPRSINVYNHQLLKYGWPKISALIDVSAGTYIRTIGVDIAHNLGTYGTICSLRRLAIGENSVDDAISSKDIEIMSEKEIVNLLNK